MVNLSNISEKSPETENDILGEINILDRRLKQKYQRKFLIQPDLTRSLVSFQANKHKSFYRWYKFKEAFSASLVEFLCHKYQINHGKVLDPFAGSGTTLFATSKIGIDADGVELLPIGQQIINTKNILEGEFNSEDLNRLRAYLHVETWQKFEAKTSLPELKITKSAYPPNTKTAIERFIESYQYENIKVQNVLKFALLCILESVSYTRKDGQYLRWDSRSGRGQGNKTFHKSEILDFESAITNKIREIVQDLEPLTQQMEIFTSFIKPGKIHLYHGSCLSIMPNLAESTYDAIITSPPYCNRYDYTRTYALELALLGVTESEIIQLRQKMLSCTVENKPKNLLAINPLWNQALKVAESHELLKAILIYLETQKTQGNLNNNSIPRMVKGYFDEMACVIQESARLLKPGAILFMVNDNVRYAGVSISVDMILCDFATQLGFTIENILLLPSDKGNSSQQMGNHGREPLRKCVYVWKKE